MIFMLYSFVYHFYQDEQPSVVPRLKNKINQSLERDIRGRVGMGFDTQWYLLKPPICCTYESSSRVCLILIEILLLETYSLLISGT